MAETFRFGDLELDEGRRCLLHRGQEQVLQPRVFDLLVYLLRHRDRVVSKDELVESVWEGAFVADGAVQRAVSLARAALRAGVPDAIRTYPRQGYRFCAEVLSTESAAGSGAAELLEAARRAFERERWQTAAEAYSRADEQLDLAAGDPERWGQALEYQGLSPDAVAPLERAVAAHAADGEPRGAARAALHLGNLLVERREAAVAAGWLRRATRYLEGQAPCREHGLLEWLTSRLALFAGRNEEALEHAERVLEIARHQEDGDLEAMGLLYTGLALSALDEPERGMARMGEAAAAVLAGEAGPWEGGLVFCGVIWSCLNRGDWRRAGEWSDQFTRWCSAHGVAGYPGLCRLHRAEVLSLQGELAEAEAEAERARRAIADSVPFAEGDAYRVLGEIRLARGDLDGSEEAFRRAHELGWDPNPGYAQLQLARGRPETALRCLNRAVEDPVWPCRQKQGFLLGHLVIAAAAAEDLDRAREALAKLEGHGDMRPTPAGRATLGQARGELALAEGRAGDAVRAFREAVNAWNDLPSPCRSAAVRLRLARALALEGDPAAARLELSSAEAAFERRCLPRLVEECRETRRWLEESEASG